MNKEQRMYNVSEGAYMTRLTVSSFRSKVSKLGIKGRKQGRNVFYTRQMLEDIYDGKVYTQKPAKKTPKKTLKKTTKKNVTRAAKKRTK